MRNLLTILLVFSFLLVGAEVLAAPGNRCAVYQQINGGYTSGNIVVVLNSNTKRRCLTIQNKSASSTLYIYFDTAGSGTQGRSLSSGAAFEPPNVPISPIYLRGSAGVVDAYIMEGIEKE